MNDNCPFPINIAQEILKIQRRLFWKDLEKKPNLFEIDYMMAPCVKNMELLREIFKHIQENMFKD